MIDWTWISNEICLIIYFVYINKKIIRFGFYPWERYKYIKKDLIAIRDDFKYSIECFVVDGSIQIKKAINDIFPRV